ncbi:MAG TPA: hypothetical protein VHT24_15435, partial [Pseudacidobacterium sp.]|nr:hypothetical protein [Pseudacidobacterium sp.]
MIKKIVILTEASKLKNCHLERTLNGVKEEPKKPLFAGSTATWVPQVHAAGVPAMCGVRMVGRQANLGLLTAVILALLLAVTPVHAQNQQDQQNQSFTMKVNSDIVLTNIVVRDKKTG